MAQEIERLDEVVAEVTSLRYQQYFAHQTLMGLAADLRHEGHSWDWIATRAGYPSATSLRMAVTRWEQARQRAREQSEEEFRQRDAIRSTPADPTTTR